jgi:hypothetical protein
MNSINIDGVEYKLGDLNETARQQWMNISYCDGEIQRLQTQLAIAQTARNTYIAALKEQLPKQ